MKVFAVDHYFCSYREGQGGGSSEQMVPESFEHSFRKAYSAVASKNFQRKYISSVITQTLFQKELNLSV